MCLLSNLKYIWAQSKVLLALAFRNIMNTYSSAALESCFPYKLMTWCTNWYCSQVWIIPPLKGKKKRGGKQQSYYLQTHEEVAQLTWSLCSTSFVFQSFLKWVRSALFWLQPVSSLTLSFILKVSAKQGTEGSENRNGLYIHFPWQRFCSRKAPPSTFTLILSRHPSVKSNSHPKALER